MTKLLKRLGIAVLFFLVSNLVSAVDTIQHFPNAEEVRAVLFDHGLKGKCFLTPDEVQNFSQVLTHMKVKTDPPVIGHTYYTVGAVVFTYWVYSEKKMDMVRMLVDFREDGSRSGYIVSDEDKKIIQALCKQLLMRAK